jgi:hypothetical protein
MSITNADFAIAHMLPKSRRKFARVVTADHFAARDIALMIVRRALRRNKII